MTREKAEKARDLLGQIERCEELLRADEGPLRAFFSEHNTGCGTLRFTLTQKLVIPNELLKDFVRQYIDYSKKEIAKLKDQLDAL